MTNEMGLQIIALVVATRLIFDIILDGFVCLGILFVRKAGRLCLYLALRHREKSGGGK